MTPRRSAHVPVKHLAANLTALKRSGGAATVILGAGASLNSGIPGWEALATGVVEDWGIDTNTSTAVEALVEEFSRHEPDHPQRGLALGQALDGAVPSPGYGHLAQLIAEGYISTVLTTNWDDLMERALYKFLAPHHVKVLVHGEASDQRIATSLQRRAAPVVVVKLHGDRASGLYFVEEDITFDPPLSDEIERLLGGVTFVVGQSAADQDIFKHLVGRPKSGSLYVGRHEDKGPLDSLYEQLRKGGALFISGSEPAVLNSELSVDVGDFDGFCTQLNLAVQLEALDRRRSLLKRAQESILTKEKRGLGYMNQTKVQEHIGGFVNQVKSREPSVVFFIHDPDNPGGMELKRRMVEWLPGIELRKIEIRGEGEFRAYKRKVVSERPDDLDPASVKKVVVLDAIAFSGKTLHLAYDKINEWYEGASIFLGVLVISQELNDQQAPPAPEIFSEVVTDRFELMFPWGVEQLTANFNRHVAGGGSEHDRVVRVENRPWGVLEVFATHEVSSSRLLTIAAHQAVSFHRHLCRDELFAALDDNIVLEVCAAELGRDPDEYDPRIESIILEKGDYVLVPRGIWHRTKGAMDRARLLEVAFGLYDHTYDIERLWARPEDVVVE